MLDFNTNRGYHNAIFSFKRRVIIGKDSGIEFEIEKDTKNRKFGVKLSPGSTAFIPPCTKNVFLKYYNSAPNNLRIWSDEDAKAYFMDIVSTVATYFQQGGNNE